MFGRPRAFKSMVVASVCTGSAMDKVAFAAVQQAMQDESVDVNFETPMCCDIHKDKRQWAREVHTAFDKTATPCTYTDISTLCDDDRRHCDAHSRCCPLPARVDVLIGGLSCKDYSKNNTVKGRLKGAELYNSGTSPGKSADCMHGFMALIDRAPPEWLLVENTDELAAAEDQRDALDLFIVDLAHRGYDVKVFLLDSSDYLLAQKRRRMFLVGILRPSRNIRIDNYSVFFQRVQTLLEAFKVVGPSLPEDMFSKDDERVRHELDLRRRRFVHTPLTSKVLTLHRSIWAKLGARFVTGEKTFGRATQTLRRSIPCAHGSRHAWSSISSSGEVLLRTFLNRSKTRSS